jgi:hypothetical protein
MIIFVRISYRSSFDDDDFVFCLAFYISLELRKK